MELMSGSKRVVVDEKQLLGMIVNTKVQRLERAVCVFYNVSKYDDLPQKAKDAIVYLCVAAFDLSRSVVCDMFELTNKELIAIGKRVDERARNEDADKKYLYMIHDLYANCSNNIPIVSSLDVEYREVV